MITLDDGGELTPQVPVEKVEPFLYGLYMTVDDMIFLNKFLINVDDFERIKEYKARVLSKYVQSKLN